LLAERIKIAMERYTYQSLAQGPNRIRLLRVSPGADDDEIKCEIFHYTLRVERASGLYEALSYVWGQESREPCRILLKNADDEQYQYLDVRSNLLAALRRLRDPDLLRVLWVDAIILRGYNSEILQPKRLLDACQDDASLDEAKKLAILIFLELNDPTPLVSDPTPLLTANTPALSVFSDLLKLSQKTDNEKNMVNSIIQESPDTCGESIYLILQERLSWGYPGTGWLSNMRDQSWTKWHKIVKQTDLCEVMVAHWNTNTKGVMSVLQFFLEEFAVSTESNQYLSGQMKVHSRKRSGCA
jgi:hypothetical protein